EPVSSPTEAGASSGRARLLGTEPATPSQACAPGEDGKNDRIAFLILEREPPAAGSDAGAGAGSSAPQPAR
ncbi:MAG: hypothetical protein KC464_30930, partial [Myxococcales bacterium]|nr:hypothetical protein [Myxococcales bacterium]